MSRCTQFFSVCVGGPILSPERSFVSGCAVDQRVSCRPVSAEDRFRSQLGPREIWWHWDSFFSRVHPVFLVVIIPPIFHIRIHLNTTVVRRTSERSLGTIKHTDALPDAGDQWTRKCLRIRIKQVFTRIRCCSSSSVFMQSLGGPPFITWYTLVNSTEFTTYMHNFLNYFDAFRPNKRPSSGDI